MERRTLWILLGIIGALVAVLCAVVAIGGVILYRATAPYQGEVSNARATVEADEFPPYPDDSPVPVTPTSPASAELPTSPAATPNLSEPQPTSTVAPAEQPAPPSLPGDAGDFAEALAPAARERMTSAPGATVYRVSARLDPDARTVVGEQIVQVTNTEDVPLGELYFRLYVNAPHYNEGGITVSETQVNGAAVEPALEVGDTALRLPLAEPLQPGQTAEVRMRFVASVPESGGYGIYSANDGVFSLYNWHPELAVYEKGGWLLNPVTDQGDPTNTDMANYDVSFSAPEGFTIVSSGVEGEPAVAGGELTVRSIAALTRNFVVVASDRFEAASAQAGDVAVTSYFVSGDEDGGKIVLDSAVNAVELFAAQFAPYPYPELDVVEVQLGGGAAGMESTGLILIGSDYYDPAQASPLAGLESIMPGADNVNVLEFVTAHEAAHQWWYGAVGSDAYTQPWLDESLTNWSSVFYMDERYDKETGLLARDLFLTAPYQAVLGGGDVRLDQPVDRFSAEEYSAVVYGKGALMYDVLRERIGDEQFFAFLRRYYERYAFGRADGSAWRDTLAEVAGQDVADEFYGQWVEGDDIRQSDLPAGGPLTDFMSGALDILGETPTPAQ